MKVQQTEIPEVLVITPTVFADDRGEFYESFNQSDFEASTGVVREWVQDNHSRSTRGVLRGLHFQNPRPQGKLVRCSAGRVFDVVVDLRQSSSSYLEWVGIELSAHNHLQLWVPEGFAHGFLALSATADVIYKTTDYYDSTADRSVKWDDPAIGIEWPLDGTVPLLSAKDSAAPGVEAADLFD